MKRWLQKLRKRLTGKPKPTTGLRPEHFGPRYSNPEKGAVREPPALPTEREP